MITLNNERKVNESSWQNSFVAMLPEIERRLRNTFCHLDHASRDEAISEGVAHSLFVYARLHERGRAVVATPATLAFYSSRQVKRGRPAAGRMNGKEPLSMYAQLGRGFRVEPQHSKWIDTLVVDKRAPVADQVIAKLDVGSWFETLSHRMKQIAKDLAFGCSTSEVARKHGVSAGRISQLRRTLEESWAEFQNESVPTLAM